MSVSDPVLRSRIVLIRIQILVPYFKNTDLAINFLNSLIFDCSKINIKKNSFHSLIFW